MTDMERMMTFRTLDQVREALNRYVTGYQGGRLVFNQSSAVVRYLTVEPAMWFESHRVGKVVIDVHGNRWQHADPEKGRWVCLSLEEPPPPRGHTVEISRPATVVYWNTDESLPTSERWLVVEQVYSAGGHAIGWSLAKEQR
jgi:hypothetical protein